MNTQGVPPPPAAKPAKPAKPANIEGQPEDRPKPNWTDLPWGVFVVIAGLLALVAVAVFAIVHYEKPADVATVMSPLTGVIVGLVGTYFGVRGATHAQEKANEAERIRRKPEQ